MLIIGILFLSLFKTANLSSFNENNFSKDSYSFSIIESTLYKIFPSGDILFKETKPTLV